MRTLTDFVAKWAYYRLYTDEVNIIIRAIGEQYAIKLLSCVGKAIYEKFRFNRRS